MLLWQQAFGFGLFPELRLFYAVGSGGRIKHPPTEAGHLRKATWGKDYHNETAFHKFDIFLFLTSWTVQEHASLRQNTTANWRKGPWRRTKRRVPKKKVRDHVGHGLGSHRESRVSCEIGGWQLGESPALESIILVAID